MVSIKRKHDDDVILDQLKERKRLELGDVDATEITVTPPLPTANGVDVWEFTVTATYRLDEREAKTILQAAIDD